VAPSVAPRWPRPSVFQAGHISSWRGPYERYALSSVAAACRWWLLLLSPLLSAVIRRAGGRWLARQVEVKEGRF
jgi:hypothetical protein